jgi:hypothetical protein
VVVGPTKGQATMVQFFTELVGRRPSQVGGVWVWWDVLPEEVRAAGSEPKAPADAKARVRPGTAGSRTARPAGR